MVPNDSQYSKNMGLDTKIKSPACWGSKLQLHSLKLSVASYSPPTLFLTIRWISASCKWSQMIPRAQKPGVRHQNQLSSMATISLGSAEWRFWERVGKLQMGQILIKMSQFFLQGTHLFIYNHRQGMLHGHWQHHVLCIVLQRYV